MSRLTHRTREERGQSLVEFALVVPLLLTVMFAIFEVGIVFKNWLTVTHAARDGARAAAVARMTGDCASRGASVARSSATGAGLVSASLNITAAPVSGCPDQGRDVSVTVRYPYSVEILGAVSVLTGDLSATSTMRTE